MFEELFPVCVFVLVLLLLDRKDGRSFSFFRYDFALNFSLRLGGKTPFNTLPTCTSGLLNTKDSSISLECKQSELRDLIQQNACA